MIHAQAVRGGTYTDLKRTMKQADLFKPQPVYYATKFFLNFGLLTVSLALLVLLKNLWLQLANAVFLAFVFAQIGFLGHDIGHRQVFRRQRWFEVSSFLVGNVLLGWSWSWWVDKHNRHHAHPNENGTDPDIDIPVLAFSTEAALSKCGILRVAVRYQGYLFLPIELLGWLAFLLMSARFLRSGRAKYPLTEATLISIHYGLYFGGLFLCLGLGRAIAFFAVHRALFGLYLGSVAAPNHKGMPVSDQVNRPDFLNQQVLSSRNVRPHPVTDYWYGGLNYQIEHHLFPTIPRNRLREAQKIVQAFCRVHDINYHETGFAQSYRETFHYLREVSASLQKA